jgi:hypothetical protein
MVNPNNPRAVRGICILHVFRGGVRLQSPYRTSVGLLHARASRTHVVGARVFVRFAHASHASLGACADVIPALFALLNAPDADETVLSAVNALCRVSHNGTRDSVCSYGVALASVEFVCVSPPFSSCFLARHI